MQDNDEPEEPCALDFNDHPESFYELPSPPANVTCWEGRWPAGGVNSADDLEQFVELQLEEMIAFQRCDDLADIGRRLGIQALKNADRYLGRFGKGDHPCRPSEDHLQQVEDVEDSLEGILRYLRQQAKSAGSIRPQATAPCFVGSEEPPLRSWTQPKLDEAIREYIAKRAGSLKSLTEAVWAERKGAVESARKMFGRNAIARALGVKSRAMVSKSEPWKQIADDLGLREQGLGRLKKTDKIGFGIAEERKSIALARESVSASLEDLDDDEEEKEAIAYARKHLPCSTAKERRNAEELIESIQKGETAPRSAVEIVNTLLTGRDDTRRRRSSK